MQWQVLTAFAELFISEALASWTYPDMNNLIIYYFLFFFSSFVNALGQKLNDYREFISRQDGSQDSVLPVIE